ncbi:hypothetical protein V6N13_029281 [Hibiscus sabdariffa]|uniref:Uncharacterized protein n=2 Tax=Hibiscus sabdariffa TaxID=183260 RepID=A0ABR2BXC9_9ROSI
MANRSKVVFFLLPLLLTTISAQTTKLTPNFYRTTCPNVESIVRSAVQQKFQQTFVTAPATLRLFFHDCFVRGCDASILLASANGNNEKDHPDDISLAGDGFDTVIKAKAAVDNGRISTKASVQRQLPHPNFNLDQLNSMFATHGLSQTDMIALSGAHTLGFAHCGKFSNRIYNFSPRNPVDPTLNFQYAMQLRQMCPRNVDPRIAINMDPNTPRTLDNVYYKNLQQGKGLFTSDQVLFSDRRSRNTVNLFASSNAAFNQAFVAAMTKLGRVGVLTGNKGEIRRDCTRPN